MLMPWQSSRVISEIDEDYGLARNLYLFSGGFDMVLANDIGSVDEIVPCHGKLLR